MSLASRVADAATLIICNDTTVPGPYGLFVFDRNLYVKPLRDRNRRDHLVMRFTKELSEDGFDWPKWRQLQAIISKLRKDSMLW